MHGRRHHHHRGFGSRWGRRIPSREQLLVILEERQKDLEEEIADIHDLIRRLADPPAHTPPDPQPAG
ncbi:MAG TPA: hypothetical protein VJ689_09395 [Gaiellaceae bacterium]|jgi:hypothetical protein|nr:hypothetical protein [Gaiellaceae bacterium]